jgi:hypothetical protein
MEYHYHDSANRAGGSQVGLHCMELVTLVVGLDCDNAACDWAIAHAADGS